MDVYGQAVGLLATTFLALVPISIGVAVLRYRLYDIDRPVSRTVASVVVVGVLAAVYAAIAIALPQLLDLPTDPSLLVAAAILAAALFNRCAAAPNRSSIAASTGPATTPNGKPNVSPSVSATSSQSAKSPTRCSVWSPRPWPATASMWLRDDQ
ncbi:hypothetical protein BH23ACT5_BH23ACT5_14150 [soil metagenome]